MKTYEVTVRITDVRTFTSCLDGILITSVTFLDGKTLRRKEFRTAKNFETGEKVMAKKIGTGKYAGYEF